MYSSENCNTEAAQGIHDSVAIQKHVITCGINENPTRHKPQYMYSSENSDLSYLCRSWSHVVSNFEEWNTNLHIIEPTAKNNSTFTVFILLYLIKLMHNCSKAKTVGLVTVSKPITKYEWGSNSKLILTVLMILLPKLTRRDNLHSKHPKHRKMSHKIKAYSKQNMNHKINFETYNATVQLVACKNSWQPYF